MNVVGRGGLEEPEEEGVESAEGEAGKTEWGWLVEMLEPSALGAAGVVATLEAVLAAVAAPDRVERRGMIRKVEEKSVWRSQNATGSRRSVTRTTSIATKMGRPLSARAARCVMVANGLSIGLRSIIRIFGRSKLH